MSAPAPIMAAAFAVRDVSVQYAGAPRAALAPLSLDVAPGECVAVIGESGSGKSTLALALMGLVPAHAGVGGTLRRGDAHVALSDRAAVARWRGRVIGLAFQDALATLHPLRTIASQIDELLRARGVSRDDVAGTRLALARDVELDPALLTRHPHQLSGGQRQRAGIALALAGEPALLIADEVTSALDPVVAGEIEALLQRLVATRGLALLLIAHDLDQVRRLAQRVVVLRAGQCVEQGDTARVLASPRHPYTLALRDAMRPRVRVVRDAEAREREDAVRFDHVVARYPKAPRATLDGIDFTIARGEVVALLGASGSGKTSLARVLLRLLPARGRVVVDGVDLLALRGAALRAARRRIGIVFQDPAAALDPRWTVDRLIAEPLRLARETNTATIATTVASLMAQVGLAAELSTRRPHELSGGQQQRVAIARALAASPALLVCDEAVSALDLTVKAQVLDLVRDLADRRHVAVLFITHDAQAVARVADRVVVLAGGRIVHDGPSARLDGIGHAPMTVTTAE